MPEWLLILLLLLVAGTVAFLLQRRAYNRGYEAGLTDAQAFAHYVDEVLRDSPPPPNAPTT